MGNEGDIKLHPQWLDVLGVEFEKDYMRTLRSFLLQRKQQQAVIYPPDHNGLVRSTPHRLIKYVW